MLELPFVKMHGLGNSYVYIDSSKCSLENIDLSSLAIHISNSATGIGADGLIVLFPSDAADISMRMFNKDGSEGKRCGNGIRCVAKYAYENGYADSKRITIETISGIVKADLLEHHLQESEVSIDMGYPQFLRASIPMLGEERAQIVNEFFEIEGFQSHLTAVSMGNPHAVFFVSDFKDKPHMKWGPQIECDFRFPERINVEFVSIKNPLELHMRVWERGSGVTQACGTGACASVVAAVLNGYCLRGQEIDVHLEGGVIKIIWLHSGEVIMKGKASRIAAGNFFISVEDFKK